LAGRRETVVGTIAFDPDEIKEVQCKAVEAEIGSVRGGVGGNIAATHYFVAHQSLRQGGDGIASGRRP
jgi:hypothetical protein